MFEMQGGRYWLPASRADWGKGSGKYQLPLRCEHPTSCDALYVAPGYASLEGLEACETLRSSAQLLLVEHVEPATAVRIAEQVQHDAI